MYKTYGNTLKSITPDVLYPDAWKIKIDIKDLTPNNFNTYINYFVYGFEGSTKILQTQLNQGADSIMNLVGDKLVTAMFGENATEEQKAMVSNLEAQQKTVVDNVLGTVMTQQDIATQQRAAELNQILNSMRSRDKETGKWTFDKNQKFDMVPLNNDGKPDTAKLVALGLNQKQIDTITKSYEDKSLTDQEKQKVYSAMYKATQRAGVDMRKSAINQRGQAFMQESVARQKQILHRQGAQMI